jgi:hypothetical protein
MRGMWVVLVGICVGAWSLPVAMAADNTPLKVKPGLWEITSEGHNSGMPAIPPEALARMTPEQRAQMEARMKGERRVVKRCVTQQEIDQGFDKLDKMNQGHCNQTVVSSTATLREGRLQCSGASNASGTYRFEAPNPETVSGGWDMTMGSADHPMKMQNNLKGKWLSTDCGDVKPGG